MSRGFSSADLFLQFQRVVAVSEGYFFGDGQDPVALLHDTQVDIAIRQYDDRALADRHDDFRALIQTPLRPCLEAGNVRLLLPGIRPRRIDDDLRVAVAIHQQEFADGRFPALVEVRRMQPAADEGPTLARTAFVNGATARGLAMAAPDTRGLLQLDDAHDLAAHRAVAAFAGRQWRALGRGRHTGTLPA